MDHFSQAGVGHFSQALKHERMLEYFGGSAAIWVPDQLKDAIAQSCRYEPNCNRTYQEMASHYGAVVIPARPAQTA